MTELHSSQRCAVWNWLGCELTGEVRVAREYLAEAMDMHISLSTLKVFSYKTFVYARA